MIELSRGKSAKAVLAARIRMANVEICSSRYRTVPRPNTWAPITESRVSVSVGVGRSRWASTDTPKNDTPRMKPIHVSVVAAFFDSSFLNAGTPFEIASVPESAIAPDENARSRINVDRPVRRAPFFVNWSSASWFGGSGARPPKYDRYRPYTMSALRAKMYTYVGPANTRPDSFTPRKFMSIMITTHARQMATR